MEHLGIDLGATRSHLVLLSSEGQLVYRRKIDTEALPRWLAKQKPKRVVMEACTQSPAIARAAKEAEHEVVIIPGNLVRALGVGARGIKTDDRDAEVLARASVRNEELPSVHVRSEKSNAAREVLCARAALVKTRTQIALNVKSWLRGRLVHLKGRANSKAFCDIVRTLAYAHADGLPMSLECLLRSFEDLTTQIEVLEEEIQRLSRETEVCVRLMTVPGVGPIIALSFVTHLDSIERFSSAEKVASYLALVAGEATTGGTIKRTATIKAGPTYLKAMLVQGAWSMWRARPNDPMVQWARRIADKRGKRIAIVALARKLAGVLYALWKHETTYDPSRAARVDLETTLSMTR